jgi:hypothetical protein
VIALQGFTQAELLALFAYDPLTGLVTRRIARANRPAGEVVGTTDGKGYLHVSVCKRFIRLHSLAWFLVTGHIAPMLDHRDGCKTNNRWVNLRRCNARQNAGNVALQATNTSGYRGVSQNGKSGLWHAQIKLHGKQTYLGRFTTPEAAARCYDKAAAAHFGDFARLNNA